MKHKPTLPGQSLAEFALVIPLVLLLLLGFFDLGRALINYSALSNAVREGTRSGIVMYADGGLPFDEAVKAKVLEYAFTLTGTSSPLTADMIQVAVSTDADGFRDALTVTANYCFVPVTPGVAALVGGGCIPLTAESMMRFEPGFK
jgi:hypothetical protein